MRFVSIHSLFIRLVIVYLTVFVGLIPYPVIAQIGQHPSQVTGEYISRMSTLTFPYTNAMYSPSVALVGWVLGTLDSISTLGALSQGASIDFTFTGTACTVTFISQFVTAVATVSIDGGSPVVLTLSALNSAQALTIATGLADAEHTAHIVMLGYNGDGCIITTNPFSVTGASPALSIPTNAGTQYLISSQSGIDIESFVSPTSQTESGLSNVPLIGFDGGIRFRAKISDCWLWMYQNSSNGVVRISIDGVDQTPIALKDSSTFDWTHFSGLDVTTQHEYIIYSGNPGDNIGIFALRVYGGTGLVTTTLSPRTVIAAVGDSITQGQGATDSLSLADTNSAWVHQTAVGFNCAAGNFGVDGTDSNYWTTHYSAVTALSPAPAFVTVMIGRNDIGESVSTSTYQTNMETILNGLHSGLSSAKIVVLGILPSTSDGSGVLASYNSALQAAVTAVGSSNVWYVDTTGWYNPAVNSDGDGEHPNTTGYTLIADRMLLSYSLTGPSGAILNTVSSNFTVELGPLITISLDSGVGTFTPSATNGTASPSTVSLTNSSRVATFDVTFTASGSQTVSTTNNVSLANPSLLDVTVGSELVAGILSYSSITSDGITLSWTSSSGGIGLVSNIAQISFHNQGLWNTFENFGWSNIDSGPDSSPLVITDLLPFSNYGFRIQFTDSDTPTADIVYSNIVTARTNSIPSESSGSVIGLANLGILPLNPVLVGV